MTPRDSLTITGRLVVEVTHDDGRVERIEQANLVTTAGLTAFAAILAGGTTLPAYIAIGTSSTAAAIGDTALVAEVDRNAVGSRTSSSAVVTIRAFFGKDEANGNTIREAGLLSAAAGGTLFCRSILSSPVAKDDSKSLSITWTLTLS